MPRSSWSACWTNRPSATLRCAGAPCDNVLTAKLLRACNSPYFGLAEPVASVDQAVFILGHQQILHIVLTIAFGSAMVVPLPTYAVEASELCGTRSSPPPPAS